MTERLSRREARISPSLSLAKERGFGGEFKRLDNRQVRKEHNGFFIFFFAPLASFAVFKKKSVKMNVDDPGAGFSVESQHNIATPGILRTANARLKNGDTASGTE